MYHVYILECADGSLYTGITTDVTRRFDEHKAGKGGHYTKAKGVVRLMYTERKRTKGAALKREYQIKQFSRVEKIALIKTAKR